MDIGERKDENDFEGRIFHFKSSEKGEKGLTCTANIIWVPVP